MKALIIPIAVGLLAGLGGGSGYAYMKASQEHAVAVAKADSLKQHADSTHADSAKASGEHGGTAHAAADSSAAHDSAATASHEPALPMTPADSLRAIEAARHGASKSTAKHDEPITTKLADVKPQGDTKVLPATPGAAAVAASPTTAAATAVKGARDAAMQISLPEQRLAKIFSAMSPKDAAKVLGQMPDADVRSVLSLMGDRPPPCSRPLRRSAPLQSRVAR
jgi:hypothetical protein